eukprot:TRINITY_DN29214_c0_g1_i2.p1 TRINITY_DN29214_c0_g1~~TRINITY_DN29214_c0_g1_i2.p1  ORF type:complete len:312 (-),score=42.02 TRINITY_DN29214_c0_g1_i2:103-1038(-)
MIFFFFQAEDGIRDVERSRGLGDVYKRQYQRRVHGGSACSEYLKHNLHRAIIQSPEFPENPEKAILQAFEEIEQRFLTLASERSASGECERAGSCALACLIINSKVFIINLGDSRALLSKHRGSFVKALSIDHKPELSSETQRILRHGGYVYKSMRSYEGRLVDTECLPARVFPGKLSVSRTIGDAIGKLPRYGGRPGVISARPEITSFEIKPSYDFVFLGCDGIYDCLHNKNIIQALWEDITEYRGESEHTLCKRALTNLFHTALRKGAYDNLSGVIILLHPFIKIKCPRPHPELCFTNHLPLYLSLIHI